MSESIVRIIECDICHDDVTNGDYRIETVSSPETGTRHYHYCFECFNRHSTECDVCNDRFVHYREHIGRF